MESDRVLVPNPRFAQPPADYARDLVVSYYKLMSLTSEHPEIPTKVNFSGLCENALLYMKQRGMFMDPPLVSLLNQLQQESMVTGSFQQEPNESTREDYAASSSEDDQDNLLDKLIGEKRYQEALEVLQLQEAEIRKKMNNADEFQSNIGQQAYVLAKMSRHREALQKYQQQGEICARNHFHDLHAECLLSQAVMLFGYLNQPQEAKMLLREAILIATEHRLPAIKKDAEEMLHSLK